MIKYLAESSLQKEECILAHSSEQCGPHSWEDMTAGMAWPTVLTKKQKQGNSVALLAYPFLFLISPAS